MLTALSASATTSLPKPAALTPAGTGRSSAEMSRSARKECSALSIRLSDTIRRLACAARGRMSGHPTGLRALTQSGEQFQPGITIGRVQADLFLIGLDCPDRSAADTAVHAVRMKSLIVEAMLDLLDLCNCWRAFTIRKMLTEWLIAANEVTKVAQSQSVAIGRVIGAHGAEILTDQKGRPAFDRDPKPHAVLAACKGRSVGAAHTEVLPFPVSVHCTTIGQA